MKALLVALLCLSLGFSQSSPRLIVSTGVVALSTAGTSVTIQQPATKAKRVSFESSTVYCSVTCTVTQAQNGTAATATLVSPVLLIPNTTITPAATAYAPSNCGSPTTVNTTVLSAGQVVTFDLKGLSMFVNGTGNNYTVSIGSITGNASISVIYTEQ